MGSHVVLPRFLVMRRVVLRRGPSCVGRSAAGMASLTGGVRGAFMGAPLGACCRDHRHICFGQSFRQPLVEALEDCVSARHGSTGVQTAVPCDAA